MTPPPDHLHPAANLREKRILVTGASGFIGSHVCLRARQCDAVVEGTYLTNTSVRVEGCLLHNVDVREKKQVAALLDRVEPDVVIHIAGTKDIEYCERHPVEAHLMHVQGTRNVAEACLSSRPRVIYISTDCVFDGTRPFCAETDPPSPFNQYGKVKLAGEDVLLNSGLSVLVLRASLLFGWVLPNQSSNTVADVIRTLTNNLSITLPTTLYNTPLYIGDAADVILAASVSKLEGVFHLAGKERLNRFDLAQKTASEFGLPSELIRPTRETVGLRPVNSCLSTSGIEKALNISLPEVARGLRAMRLQKNALVGLSLDNTDTKHENRPFPRRL